MNDTPIWQRQPYETDAAFNSFHEFYLTQSHPRSVDEAYRRYKGLSKGDKKRPPLSFRRWSQGLNKDGSAIEGGLSWPERARAYDDHLAQLREAEFEKRHMGAVEALALLADQARGNLGDFADVKMLEDLKDHPKSGIVKALTSDVYEDKMGRIHYKSRIELQDQQRAIEGILKIHGKFSTDVTIDIPADSNFERALKRAYGNDDSGQNSEPTESNT